MKRTVLALLTVLIILSGCSSGDTSSPVESKAPSKPSPSSSNCELSAENILAGMSLEEKAAQLFTVTVADGNAHKDICFGGVILFGGDFRDPATLTALTASLKSGKRVPPIISVDEEGGVVERIASKATFDVPRFGTMYSIGETGKAENAFKVGSSIALYLKDFGIDADLAPVADVFTDKNNTVIGERSFSSDPEIAAKMVSACTEGFHSLAVMTAAKHFPGHGNTAADSHNGAVHTGKSWDELLSCEMLPFIAAIKANTDMIMVGHITADKVSGDGLPATLSKVMITDKLRGELGYGGVVITDALNMDAITDFFSSAEAAKLALSAGADILLMPEDVSAAYGAVLDAVKSGEISEQRINESVLRILDLKLKYEIIK